MKCATALLFRTRLIAAGSSRFFVSGRSFKILGVQQIAIGALDKKVLSDFWVGKLGIEKVSEYRSEVS
jgi:lactoylglutathione lyase